MPVDAQSPFDMGDGGDVDAYVTVDKVDIPLLSGWLVGSSCRAQLRFWMGGPRAGRLASRP